jgi:hypothetical protein
MSYFKGIGRKSGSYTGRKLPLVGLLENKKHTIFNEYTPGSGVGASSVATRRLKKQRARIKKCIPPEPIYPELDENEYFEISDDIKSFTPQLEAQVNALPSGTTINLGNNTNKIVDENVYTTRAKSLIKEVSTSNTITSLTFATISEENIADSAVETKQLSSVNELLSSNEYIVTTSVNYVTPESDPTSESQYIEHTFINTGTLTDGIPNIQYIMTITEFMPLQ